MTQLLVSHILHIYTVFDVAKTGPMRCQSVNQLVPIIPYLLA